MKAWPTARTAARENRAFLGRAVRYLAEEAGITQFLDIGSGLPSVGNVHEVAQDVNPPARVVYVDNDPIVLAHARALLNSAPEGKPSTSTRTCGTRRDPRHPVSRDTLDFNRPVALIFVACCTSSWTMTIRPIVAPWSTLCRPAATWQARAVTSEFSPDTVNARATSTRSGVAWPADADVFADLRSRASRWCCPASWWCPSGARSRARSCGAG